MLNNLNDDSNCLETKDLELVSGGGMDQVNEFKRQGILNKQIEKLTRDLDGLQKQMKNINNKFNEGDLSADQKFIDEIIRIKDCIEATDMVIGKLIQERNPLNN